ncbi:MAG: transposase [Oscillibacter sp.]|uniref:transposase n=1 Tax=Oscillibacter sp. TaxID=1945593 RepID=UPI00216D00A1|nr:transposase [Oscillibacter sp.]MCI9113258.1 transposase [Oscillibacter sp.]
MYLLQCWFSLSDEGAEDAIYDSYAMRRFIGFQTMPLTGSGILKTENLPYAARRSIPAGL